MTAWVATTDQNIDQIGFQFWSPIDATQTAYYQVNGANWTTSGNIFSTATTWTGWDFSDDGLCVLVSAAGTGSALLAPTTAGGAATNRSSFLPAGSAWTKCVYGNGSFVSICTSTTSAAYMRHKEGVMWTATTLPSAAAWSLLAFGNNTFVTVAPSSTAGAYSTNNGLSWTSVTLPAQLAWADLKFANGVFVLVASGSRDVYTSSDGQQWTLRSNALPQTAAWKMISWAAIGDSNGTWVAVPSSGATAAYSKDNGVTWTAATLPASGNWLIAGGKAAWDGKQMFTALTISSTAGAFSYDGINWSSVAITSAAYNKEFKLIQPRLVSGDSITVNNNATLTVNSDQKRFLTGATALVVTNGKVSVQNTSTTTPIRFGTGRLATTAVVSTIDCTNGLGSFESSGNWIEIGTSAGSADQTFTSPYQTGDYIPSVWVETAAGSGTYEAWVNVSGAPDYNQYNYFRNGFRSVGKGDGGAVFTQDYNQAACQYLMLANTNAIANTNIVTCTSTAGLVPGAWVYSRSLSSGTAVVQEVLNSTTFTVNVVTAFTASSSTAGFSNIPMAVILPLYAQNTTTLRFGNDVNGKIPPAGAKIRVPNIMLTDYSPANFMNAAFSSSNAPFCLRTTAGGGKFVFDKTLFGESYSTLAQASSVSITNCGGSYVPFVSECYQTTLNNVAFGLPPVYQVVGAPTALGATGSCTAASTTVTIPSSTAIIPGVLLTGTGLHANTVTTVSSATSLIVSTAAHTTSSSVAYSYYGQWTSREHRMLLGTTAAFGSTLTNAPWTYVSNANIQNVTMTFGGHAINGTSTNPSIGSAFAGFLGLAYSNDVTINNFKGIQVGSYPKTRPSNTAFSPNSAGANHTYSNIKLYNVNGVMGCSAVINTAVTNVTHRSGINNEGYNWASGARVIADVKNNTYIPKDTQYWFKTRSYKTLNFQDTTSYVDSMPMSGVHGNFPKYFQMPQRVGIVPAWSQATAPALAYGNGSWVFLDGSVATGGNTVMVSDDNGVTWTAYQLPVTNTTASTFWKDIIWCPTQNYFMAINGGGAANTLVAISTNGKDWSTVTTAPASAQWTKLAFDNSQATNKWVGVSGGTAVSTAGTYATNTTGSFVFAASTLASAQWIDVAASGAGRFVAIAGGTAVGTASSYSTNGSTWTAGGTLASSLWQSIAYGSAKFVAISASATNGPTAYSTDGTAWTASTAPTLPTGMTYSKILWTGTVFVAMAGPAFTATMHTAFTPATASACYATSTDGITWSALKYLPDITQWVAMANNGNAVGFISAITGRFAYTPDISAATPTWNVYSDVMTTYNRISLFHQSTEFTTALNTAASVATTLNSTTVTCTSTAGLQVGTVVVFSAGNMVANGAMYFAGGSASSNTSAAIVTSITNATTFVINKPALKTASGMTATFYKGVYSLYRSTTPGFTARDATTLIGSTQSITAGQMIFNDSFGVQKGTTYYYRLRKMSGGGAASITNCSGTASTSTITTQGSWYYWQSSFDMDGKSGTNVITSLVFNFFANGIIPGAIVTGPGIPAGTTVIDVPDFDTIVLSANLTADVQSRGANRTYVGLSPAPGMYIYGSNVGLDSKVTTVDSATSMTVSVANTNTFTNQTLRFVVGQELPEFASIATAPKIIQNQALQSDALATTWTASGITATNAAVLSPLDNFVGINAAAPAATGCTLLATTANGTLTQTINTGVGSQYTFSIYLRARHPDLRNYITTSLTLGTAVNNLTLTNQWKRYSVTFTTTASTTNAVITLPLLGSVVEAAKAMVTLGSAVPVPTPANTTVTTAFAPEQWLNFTDGLSGYFLYDAPAGIVTNLQTAPAGQLYAHLHVDTTPNFTITDQNQVYSTESSGSDQIFGYTSGATKHVVNNYAPASNYVADRNQLLWVANGVNDITVKNSTHSLNGTVAGNLLNYTTAGYNIYFHNINLINPRNYIAAQYIDSAINNATSGIKYQNIKSTLSGIYAWGNQSLSTVYKGTPGCDSLPTNTATTWNLSTNPTQDGLPVSSTNLAAVYDDMFHEMTWGAANKGCLDLRMTPSSKAVKPYTVVSGAPFFDNSGGLFFTTTNDVVTFEWPHTIKGVTGFSKRMPHVYGVDIGLSPVTSLGALIEYDLDRGTGYSNSWKRINGFNGISNLSTESAFNPATGFKIKFRVSAKYVMKYTGQTAQFVVGETLRNNVLAAASTAGAVVVEDETVSTTTTGSLVCSNITGAWTTGDTIFSSTLATSISATTANTSASLTSSTISGTVLTVGTLASGTIVPGMLLTGTGVTSGTYIVSNISGSGSGSTWTVNFPQGVTSTTITGAYAPITVASTANLHPSMGFRVDTAIGGLVTATTYYVLAVVNATTFTATTTQYGTIMPTLSTASGSSNLVGIHGTISSVNTVGVFAPQPTSKLMAVRIFTDLDNSLANYYPESINTVTFTGLPIGTDMVVLRSGTNTILYSVDQYGNTNIPYQYSGADTIDIGFIKTGYVPFYIRNLSIGTTDASIPVSMTQDRNYI